MWFSLGVNFVLSAIDEGIKNEKAKAKYKKKLLEIWKAIGALYPEDTQ